MEAHTTQLGINLSDQESSLIDLHIDETSEEIYAISRIIERKRQEPHKTLRQIPVSSSKVT